MRPALFIEQAVKIATINDYSGVYTELGGGELNDTFLIHCDSRDVILRVSRNPERNALNREAKALSLLEGVECVPKLVFFDPQSRINGYLWIAESRAKGVPTSRLNSVQFYQLGTLLSAVHAVHGDGDSPEPWEVLVANCHRFGNEEYLYNHPDERLRAALRAFHRQSKEIAKELQTIPLSLVHCDITPSNTLVNDNKVSLIDWELSGFKDPMSDFSTGYYSDMELNNGKWRQQLTSSERHELYAGYTDGGGVIDEPRILAYQNLDKLGVASYLYWRLHVSEWKKQPGMEKQYAIDYANIITSLTKTFLL